MSSQSKLPLELMMEIFRSSELYPHDLASCCLLARKYLPSAQKLLYHSVDIELVDVVSAAGGAIAEYQYDKPTWSLLQTLSNASNLRSFADELSIGVSELASSGIRTTRTHAFLNFLDLAPNVRRVMFDRRVDRQDNEVDQSNAFLLVELDNSRWPSLVGIDIGVLGAAEARILSEFKGLKRLAFAERDDETVRNYTPPQLESLCIERHLDLDLTRFLSASTDTLTRLHLPFNAFLEIDFNLYPKLTYLEIFESNTEVTIEQLARSTAAWSSFSKSQLTTLAFDGHAMTPDLEEAVFGADRLLHANMPSALRRIDFNDSVSLDRIHRILGYGCVEELGIAEREIDRLKYLSIQSMCSEGEVVLIRMPWSGSL